MLAQLLLSLLLAVNVPAGFQIDLFAKNLEGPRAILVLDDGTVLVSRPAMNDVVALRDTNGDGVADDMRTAIASVEQAQSLAMLDRTLYVAGANRIVAAERLPDGSFGDAHDVVDKLPAGARRALGIGPDGKVYVAVGSACSDCTETHPEHATLLQFDADGSHRRIYARGLGDTAAIDAHPKTGDLWSANGGELNRLGDGLDYGWPFCIGKNPASDASAPAGMTKEKFCRSSEAAALELPARASGFAFYRGAQFPESFRGDAFAASGAKVVRIRFEDDKPVAVEEFASGAKDIAGLAAAPDGALLFSDEASGAIYRVTYGSLPRSMTSSGVELAAKPVLSQAFRVDDLRGPASVLHDEEQDIYFVSNVDGAAAAKDGKGFISRITPDGKVAERTFIDGLDAPKGMTVRGTELWIADIDVVRVFDRITGASLRNVDLAPHGAIYLDDIAAGPDEAIYVTDMDVRIRGEKERLRQGNGRIFRITGDADDVEIASADEELRSPSGIAWDGTRFLIAQSYGNEVLAWNRGAGTTAVLRGPGAYDGIVVLPNGTVIVSSRYDDALHVGLPIATMTELRPLFARKPSPADIGFDRKRNRLLIPSTDGDWVEAWTLPPMTVPTRTARDGAKEVASIDLPRVP